VPDQRTQIKFTVESELVALFKSRCTAEGVSMTSVIRQWMKAGRPTKSAAARLCTRPGRRQTIREVIVVLESLLQREAEYRDAIPEVFQGRYETADHSCEQVEQAIACLEEAY